MSWPTGQAEIRRLLAERLLDQVTPDREGAEALLEAAGRHLDSALVLATADPEGAYALIYDGTRKSLAALLLTQGLRPTAAGGHRVIQDAIRAQFTAPPPRDAFRPFARMRTTRHHAEYDAMSSVDEPLVRADHSLAVELRQVAVSLLPHLPVF